MGQPSSVTHAKFGSYSSVYTSVWSYEALLVRVPEEGAVVQAGLERHASVVPWECQLSHRLWRPQITIRVPSVDVCIKVYDAERAVDGMQGVEDRKNLQR